MGFWEYFFISITVIAVLIFILQMNQRITYVKDLNTIKDEILSINSEFSVELFEKDHPYQIKMESLEKVVLIKLVKARDTYEFIITNANKWAVNSDPKQWSRRTKPNFIEGSETFIKYSDPTKKLIKVVLIHPTCKHVIQYLNESDTIILKEEKPVQGINFIKYNNFSDFVKNQ